eukprot:GEMP01044938.1.p1 GENE.GEMP01044938.1~~GEMP01044938.1.p1  ORF type:complete len:562 (+),score=137.35 GEMP01044938.1:78-1763(+)
MYPAAAMEAYRRNPGGPPSVDTPPDVPTLAARVLAQYPLHGAAGVHYYATGYTPAMSGPIEHPKTAAQRWSYARTMSKLCVGWRHPAPRLQYNPRSTIGSHDGTGEPITQETDLPSVPVRHNQATMMQPPINAINTRGAYNIFAHPVRDTTLPLRARSAQQTRPRRRCVVSSSYSTMQPLFSNCLSSSSHSAMKPVSTTSLPRSSSERAFPTCHVSVGGGVHHATAPEFQRTHVSLWTQRPSFSLIPRAGQQADDPRETDVLSDVSYWVSTPDFEQVSRGRSTSVPATTCCTPDYSGHPSPTGLPDGSTNSRDQNRLSPSSPKTRAVSFVVVPKKEWNSRPSSPEKIIDDANPATEKSGSRKPELREETLSENATRSRNDGRKGGPRGKKEDDTRKSADGAAQGRLNEEATSKAGWSQENGVQLVQQQHDALAQLQETRRQIEARIQKIQETSLRATGVSDVGDIQASPVGSPHVGDWRSSVMEGQLEDAWREIETVREENRRLRKEREEALASQEMALSQNKQLSEQIERQSQRNDGLTIALESLRNIVRTTVANHHLPA